MKTLIIAEAGVNHNGDINTAKELIDVAADAGVDYVKFQTFKTDKLVSMEAEKAEYQKINLSDKGTSQYDMLKNLELSEEDHYELLAHAKGKGIGFLSTGFDEESIDFLDKMGIEFFKVPSGEITNRPYLEHIGKKCKPVVLSTGMANMFEIEMAVQVLLDAGLDRKKITILHCNTEYPTPMADVNLRAMLSIKNKMNLPVGYSDHTLGIEVPIAAVAMGSEIIEKHFTLSRKMEGPDHNASLEPEELRQMVRAIRNIEMALSGSGEKTPSRSESKNISVARKSIHLSAELKAGQKIERSKLIMKRPGDGISPMDIDKVIGKTVRRQLKEGTKLSFEHLT